MQDCHERPIRDASKPVHKISFYSSKITDKPVRLSGHDIQLKTYSNATQKQFPAVRFFDRSFLPHFFA